MEKIYEIVIKNREVARAFPHLFQTKKKSHYVISPKTYEQLKTDHIPFSIIKKIDIKNLKKRIVVHDHGILFNLPESDVIHEVCAKILSAQKERRIPYAIYLGRKMELEPGAFILDRPGGKRRYQWRLIFRRPKKMPLVTHIKKQLTYPRKSAKMITDEAESLKVLEVKLTDPTIPRSFSHIFPTGKKHHFMISIQNYKHLRANHIPVEVIRSIDLSSLKKRIIFPLRSFLYSPPEAGAVAEVCAKMLSEKKHGRLPYVIFLGRNPNLEPGAFLLDRAGGRRHYQWKLTAQKPQVKSLSQAFPKLLRHIKDTDTKFVISFGSGGLRFLAHASMMKFINAIGARPYIDEIWGCSGGSIAGLVYAMGVAPERLEQEGYDAYNERFNFSVAPSILTVAKNIILDALAPANVNLLKGFVSVHNSIQTTLSHLVKGREIEIPFYCLAYNVKRERNQILTPFPVPRDVYGEKVIRTSAIDAVVASSSIPIIYVPKVIRRGKREEEYIDGGTIEEVPLASIYRKWQIDREQGLEKRHKIVILAVDLFPRLSQQWFDVPLVNKLPVVTLINVGMSLIDIVRRARIHDQTEPLLNDPNTDVLTVTLPLRSLSVLNTKDIPIIIKSAQTSFLDQMLQLEAKL